MLQEGDAYIEQFARVLPLNLISIKQWAQLPNELGVDLEVSMNGGFMVAESEDDVGLLERKYAIEKEWKLPTRLLTGKEARSHAPYLSDKVCAAGYCPKEGHANPRLVTLAFAKAAVKLGSSIVQNYRVTNLHATAGSWEVQTAQTGCTDNRRVRTFMGHVLLNAAWAWAGYLSKLAGLDHKILLIPLLMNVTDHAQPIIPHLIQHVSRQLSLKQVRDGNVIIGGGWASHLDNWDPGAAEQARPTVIPRNVESNIRVALSIVPCLKERHLIRCWTGLASLAADQLPFLGKSRHADNYFMATSGSAFTLDPTYARLIAEYILLGVPSMDISLYDPDRCTDANSNSRTDQTHAHC